MPSITEQSPLHRPDRLAAESPAFAEARRTASSSAEKAAQARAAVDELTRRKAETEAAADRAALEALKGRGPEDEPRRLAEEADRIGGSIPAAEDEAQKAEAKAATARHAVAEVQAAERARIAAEAEERYKALGGRFASHIAALLVIAKEAQEAEREMLRLGVSLPFRSIGYDYATFSHINRRSDDRADAILGWVERAGVEIDPAIGEPIGGSPATRHKAA